MSKLSRTVRSTLTALLLVTAVAVLPSSATAAPEPSTGAPAAATDSVSGLDRAALRRALAEVPAAGAPGVLAAVRAGRADWAGAAGIADLSKARPAQPQMRHRVGSITKTFVATVLLQLVDEGRLDLDDPVGDLLPGALPDDLGQLVTVRMLLNHTSGIGNYTTALLNSLDTVIQVGQTSYTPDELVAIGVGLPRTGEPGEAFSYSNTNYLLAGLILQRLTGNDPADEISRRILRPLRLTETYFPGADSTIRGPHAGAYFAPLVVRDFSGYDMSWAWMAGELIATMPDLNTFFRALLGGKLLSPAALAQMRTTVPFVPGQPEFGGYGLGIYEQPTPCGSLWGHDGSVVGHLAISLHSADGARQVSTALNVSHFWIFASDPHPIDLAWQNVIMTGHCGGSEVAGRSAVTPLRLPATEALGVVSR
nr:serine hydrolase domain-containing protein [Micromonospora sp. DSM 115978]